MKLFFVSSNLTIVIIVHFITLESIFGYSNAYDYVIGNNGFENKDDTSLSGLQGYTWFEKTKATTTKKSTSEPPATSTKRTETTTTSQAITTSNIDYCDPDPCENGGTCHVGIDDYTCVCVLGYKGYNCTISNS